MDVNERLEKCQREDEIPARSRSSLRGGLKKGGNYIVCDQMVRLSSTRIFNIKP
jgi:hypothetical protein